MTALDRCIRYLETMEPSISGQRGHDAAFRAACVIVQDFGLAGADAAGAWREFNRRCMPPWSERESAHKLRQAERASPREGHSRGWMVADVAGRPNAPGDSPPRPMQAPVRERPAPTAYDEDKLRRFAEGAPLIDREWLRRRSPLPVVHGVRPGIAADFLEALYEPGERVLVFWSEMSQGDWLYEVGRGAFRLGREPGVRATPAELPTSGKNGIWFLAPPVSGQWEKGSEKMTRRSAVNVTSWRWMVLESDDAPADLWLRALAKLPLPISALYTSGGRSVHALVRIGAESKAEWDAVRDAIKPPFVELGADPGVFSAVRLTRLPGCYREGKTHRDRSYTRYPKPRPQELLWLDPHAKPRPLMLSPIVR